MNTFIHLFLLDGRQLYLNIRHIVAVTSETETARTRVVTSEGDGDWFVRESVDAIIEQIERAEELAS